MNKLFSKKEINKILSNYNIGDFKKYGNIKKDDIVSFGQIIETTSGKYFMKVFKKFDKYIEQSVEINIFLKRKKFPTYDVFKTKLGKTYLDYNNQKIIFYEYIPYLRASWKNLNFYEIQDFGKTLGIFHRLTKDMKIHSKGVGGYANIKFLINDYYVKRNRFGKEIQNVLEFMKNEISRLECPNGEYFTGYYSEFNPGHVKFKNNKLKYVIDWEIDKNYAFFDYGSSMIACFSPDGSKFYPKKLKRFINSYSKERSLSNWELKHLFEAFKFGILKYGIWGFVDLQNGELVLKENQIDNDELNKIKFLMGLDKNLFYDMIK